MNEKQTSAGSYRKSDQRDAELMRQMTLYHAERGKQWRPTCPSFPFAWIGVERKL